MYYKGRFTPKNPQKYRGDVNNIRYRSSWEYATFMWLDSTPEVIQWASEELFIPYRLNQDIIEECMGSGFKTDGKEHRYFVDLQIIFKNGQKYLIEIKPENQTVMPRQRSRKTRKYLTELLTYVQNRSKWEAASEFAADQGWIFEVWTEKKLRSLGVRII